MKNDQDKEQHESLHTKEGYIQFLRGTMTEIVERNNSNDPERLKKSRDAIDFLCAELSLR